MTHREVLIFRTIEERDIARHGNRIVCELLKQAGFDLDGPIDRYYEPVGTDRESGTWVFCQDVNWRISPRFKGMREALKKSTPIHSQRSQGSICAV